MIHVPSCGQGITIIFKILGQDNSHMKG